ALRLIDLPADNIEPRLHAVGSPGELERSVFLKRIIVVEIWLVAAFGQALDAVRRAECDPGYARAIGIDIDSRNAKLRGHILAEIRLQTGKRPARVRGLEDKNRGRIQGINFVDLECLVCLVRIPSAIADRIDAARRGGEIVWSGGRGVVVRIASVEIALIGEAMVDSFVHGSR